MTDAAFDTLFAAAAAVRGNAYAPYSGYHVGAALLAEDGSIFAGANVENAAFPQGQCAEANAIGAMASAGRRRIVAVALIGGPAQGGDDTLCTPCGGCRQRLREFAAPETPVYLCGPEGLRRTMTLDELLPASFGPDNLSPGKR